MVFCSNVDERRRVELATQATIPIINDLGRYFGVLSIHKSVTASSFTTIIERISSRLVGWKTRTLSFARMVTLAKSVLLAILYYPMQTMLVPAGVCDKIEGIIRLFIWGRADGNNACHLVSCETLTKLKCHSELGIKHMQGMNRAFLTKLGWKMVMEKDRLWAKVLNSKYKHNALIKDIKQTIRNSNAWKRITLCAQNLRACMRRSVCNG